MDQPAEQPISDLPVMLKVRNKRCVVVGAGGVGARRARLLADAGARVVIVAMQVHPAARLAGEEIRERAFEDSDLDGALLVIAATDIPEINDAVCQAAAERGVLINRADDGEASELTFMSSHRDGPLTIAVHTGGASANAAVRIRDTLVDAIDPQWGRLLGLALPVRRKIQQRVADPAKRTAMLRRLTDDDALAALKSGGESALHALYADIMNDLA